jgi:hypothetical protein
MSPYFEIDDYGEPVPYDDDDEEFPMPAGPACGCDGPHCMSCGCCDHEPCEGGCIWATPNLCSRCA